MPSKQHYKPCLLWFESILLHQNGSVSDKLAEPVFMRKSACNAGLRGAMFVFDVRIKTDETALKRSIKFTVNAQ